MPDPTAASASLPPQPTTFIGRAAELAELARLLADPACRLVTIVGPGGIGKTRLALAAAARAGAAFADGTAFASLQAVPASDGLAPAMAGAVGCPHSGPGELRDRLRGFLRDKQLLLVLDNVEHLLDGAGLASDILAAAPGVRFLVTSREALNLQEEWRFPLAGLPVPADAAAEDWEGCDAARLFIERARRVRHDFDPAVERVGIVRLCQLTEGSPLALELAASWTRTASCAAIAAEVARNLASLATDLRNVPARHRSLRATCDYSWQLLTDEERAVFRRLGVFRGGFRREAATAVAAATLPVLAALVDQSLVRYEADGRYHLHELLRQYADERLATAPDEAAQVRRRHSAYYLDFLAARSDALAGGDQRAALAEIGDELDNVRAAWEWAVAEGEPAALHRAIHPLEAFFQFRGRYQEGIALLTPAVVRLRAAGRTRADEQARASLHTLLAWLHIRIGRLVEARQALEESMACADPLAAPPPGLGTDPELGLAVLALVEGDYAGAAALGEAARRRAAAQGHQANLALAWYVLANAALAQGQHAAARQAAGQAHAAALAAGDRWFLAYCLGELGAVAFALGDLTAARSHFEAGYAIREEFADPEGMAVALASLGRIALLQADYGEAAQLFERAGAHYRDIGDRGGQAGALHGLGLAALGAGDHDAAGRHLARALDLAAEIRFVPLVLAAFATAGELLLRTGRAEQAVGPLALAGQHPAAKQETRERAARLLAEAGGLLPVDLLLSASERGHAGKPAAVARELAALLTAPRPATEVAHRTLVHSPPPGGVPPPLPEPLTERELAVLRLIAAGRSNREIAAELFLTVSTVKWYAGNLFGKLGTRSRTAAVARARELGLLA